MTFSLNSLAALCVALNSPRAMRWLMASGGLAGLAMLSKSPAVLLSIAAVIIILMNTWRRRSFGHAVRAVLVWGMSAAAIFFLLYPAMWAAPVQTVLRMRTTAENFSETAHTVNYFNGSSARVPGPLFYPVVPLRSTPILWLGLIAGVVLIVRAKSEHDRTPALRGGDRYRRHDVCLEALLHVEE